MLRLVEVENRAGLKSAPVRIAREFADPRLELARLLHAAAEIEHALMLQYLYASFSLKDAHADVVGDGRSASSDTLLGVAVQEMHHFRDVNRILVRLGETPNVLRDEFPYQPEIYPFEMNLERLSAASIAKYVYAEAPKGGLDPDAGSDEDRDFARRIDRLLPPKRPNHIGTLYGAVLECIDQLADAGRLLGADAIRRTIDAIRSEGEQQHFTFFRDLFLGRVGSLRDVPGAWSLDESDDRHPSLPVARDPSAVSGRPNLIADPLLLDVAQLANLHYWAALLLLGLHYLTESTASELGDLAVRHMTQGLQPLGRHLALRGSGIPFDPLALGTFPSAKREHDLATVRRLLEQADALTVELRVRGAALPSSVQALARTTLDALPRPRTRATVVGTGPAGLAAAMALASRGIEVRVLERSSLIGGKVNSEHRDGRSLEHGVHGWWKNYLNFDQLLRAAGVDLEHALKPAQGSNIALADGTIHALGLSKTRIPSPFFLLTQMLSAPYLRIVDLLRAVRFAIHLIAFEHERDYERFDRISSETLMTRLGVPERLRDLVITPFILSFDFTVPVRASAAAGLSGLEFYLLPTHDSILTRWSHGSPVDTVFGPLRAAIERQGGRVAVGVQGAGAVVENGAVRGVQTIDVSGVGSGGITDIADEALAAIPEDRFVSIPSAGGDIFARRAASGVVAFRASCPHLGCNVAWTAERDCFVCRCHNSAFAPDGALTTGPATTGLTPIEARIEGDRVLFRGAVASSADPCDDVVLACDLEGTKSFLAATPGCEELCRSLAELSATPVIVVRMWFSSAVRIPKGLESAITPDAKFADNFFHVNEFAPERYDREGTILEVQGYRVDEWLARSDAEVLAATLADLRAFIPVLMGHEPEHFTINRHRALFTLYAPGHAGLQPSEQTGIEGLYLAGDWTSSPFAVWMMERGVVSGLRAANAVLRRHALEPVAIERLPEPGLVLRWSRRLCRWLRDHVLADVTSAPEPERSDASAATGQAGRTAPRPAQPRANPATVSSERASSTGPRAPVAR